MNAHVASRKALLDQLPTKQSDLPPRTMLDSYDEAVIPLKDDLDLRERYLTHFGGVRIGRLLEDMDVFAVHIVFKHMLNPKQDPEKSQSPFSIVTALVDKINVKTQIVADRDIKLCGHVTWVGRSSVEVTLHLLQYDPDAGWEHITNGTFVMVVRDAMNAGSSFVNPLTFETEEELALFARRERNKIERLGRDTDSLFNHPPSEEEKYLSNLKDKIILTQNF